MKLKFIVVIVLAIVAPLIFLLSRKPDKRIETLTRADRIEVFRVKSSGKITLSDHIHPDRFFRVWRIIGTSAITEPQSKAALVRVLKRYLQDASSHRNLPGCVPNAGLGFRVWQGDEHLDAEVCFSCDLIGIGHQNGGLRNMANNRAAIVRLAKQAFPRDAIVQKLDEHDPSNYDAANPNARL